MVSLIYAAAIAPAGWDEAMVAVHEGFAGSTGATGTVRSAVLAIADGSSRSMIGTLLPDAAATYTEDSHLDHVVQAVERGPVGTVRTGDELIAPRTATEFHQRWVKPNDLEDGFFVRLTTDVNPTTLIVAGSKRSRPFATKERTQLVSELVPHFQQSLSMRTHFAALAERSGAFAEAIDHEAHGIVVVTKDLQIVDCNAAALQILSERDGLSICNGALLASLPVGKRNLSGLAYHATTTDGIRYGGSVRCERFSGKRAYVIHVVPLSAGTVGVGARSLALVLIVDPARDPAPASELLRQLYGLTHAEAAVAHFVLYGDGVRAIGERLSLSSTTVKTHLRAIFAKTGTHRQAELVRVLSAVIP